MEKLIRRTKEEKTLLHIKAISAELRRFFLIELQYPLHLIGTVITLYLLFRAITWGSSLISTPMAGEAYQEGITERLIGFVFFIVMSSIMQQGPVLVQEESILGVFEQVYLSPLGIAYIVLCRGLSTLIIGLAPMLLMFGLGVLTLPIQLRSFSIMIPIVILIGALGMLGIGYLLTGLGLLFKKTNAIVTILTLLLLAISSIPLTQLSATMLFFVRSFPFTQSNRMVTMYLTSRIPLVEDYIFLITSSLFIFVIGLFFLQYCEKVAKRKGLLGKY